jgi:hypothetical protein
VVVVGVVVEVSPTTATMFNHYRVGDVIFLFTRTCLTGLCRCVLSTLSQNSIPFSSSQALAGLSFGVGGFFSDAP